MKNVFRALPLPCIILNANRRTKNGGGMGTRLFGSYTVNYFHLAMLVAKLLQSAVAAAVKL